MTRLPDGVARPALRRVATSSHGDLVVILDERIVTLKPKRARANGIVTVTWGAVYQRAIEADIIAQRKARRRAPRAARKPE